ncbi:MAG TPA: STAS domain-containing protein [Leptospiraceae bacterium]|nr:STAS domain-containing protein [Leptospiraceae bacterium]HRG77828.1 STAS domain-containing protein [Leptospiraceae bacterium]
MIIELILKPPFAVFRFEGRFGFAELRLVKEKLNPVLDEEKYKIIFELKDLETIDSSGVALLFRVSQRTSAYKDGSFFLVSPSPFVKDILLMSGVFNKFIVFGSTEDAIQKSHNDDTEKI